MSDWPTNGDETAPDSHHGTPDAAHASAKRSATPPRPPKKSTTEVSPVLRNWQVLEPDGETHPDTTRADAVASAAYIDSDLFDGTGIEIEGEATVVEATAAAQIAGVVSQLESNEAPHADGTERLAGADVAEMIPDQQDPAIVVALAARRQQVHPGEEATYALTILNNGTEPADFRVTVEGWLNEAWLTTPVPQVALAPGEERTVRVTLAPPRQTTSWAGDYALAFVVREFGPYAAHYGQRMTRLGAMLTILPYTDLRLGHVQPTATLLSWWQKQAVVTVPLVNRSNHAVTVALHVRQSPDLCNCTVVTPRADTTGEHETARGGREKHAQLRRSTTTIGAGESVKPLVYVRLRNHPLVALRKIKSTLQIITATATHNELPQSSWVRTTTVAVTAKPLFGIWHLTSLLSLVMFGVMAAGMAGVAALLLFSLEMRQPEPIPAAVQPIAAPPVIVAYIQAPVNSAPVNSAPVNSAPVTNAAGPAVVSVAGAEVPAGSAVAPIISMGDVTVPGGNAANLTAAGALPDVVVVPGPVSSDGATTDGASIDSAPLPIISQAQVSAPGAVAPAASPVSPAAEAAQVPAAAPAPMTYATLFREIAGRYGLSWRILAAQAYVESGFDAVALGKQGDLGLMQILPATWHEWAPTVAATDPFDSYSNVSVAAAYLHYLQETLRKQGHPEIEWTLVAYNWGIDKVLQHLKSGKGWDDLAPVRREYAIEVLHLAETIPADG